MLTQSQAHDHKPHDRSQPSTNKSAPSGTANPRAIKPLGNLIFQADPSSSRDSGLGTLSLLSDDILLLVFSELSPTELYRSQSVSKWFFAWCAGLDCLWKPAFIAENQGRLSLWRGSWRATYLFNFVFPQHKHSFQQGLPSDSIRTEGVFSDVLFQPILCASQAMESIIRSKKRHPNIDRLATGFSQPTTLPRRPAILTGLMNSWEAYNPRTLPHPWSLDSLIDRFPNVQFQAESTLATFDEYKDYHDQCALDESPVYMFDSRFVEKTSSFERGMGADFEVPEIFQQDLFCCLGDQRPDHRWLIIGPARSGSTWHIDPNGTSAWNAVISGRKLWICFPPHITPPGVNVSEDQGEVESPLSIAEWFTNYYSLAKSMYGQFAKDANTPGQMLEGICEAGEIFFVPSGWWHLVVNLEPSIAVTQNFVSQDELASVLHFMKYKPHQLSGFKHQKHDGEGGEADEDVFTKFVDRLRQSEKIDSQVLETCLTGAEVLELERRKVSKGRKRKEGVGSVWERLKKTKVDEKWDCPEGIGQTDGDGSGFVFGFQF